ncbi:MAG: LamG-like jellyroll fold domain-containing protein, partial [Ignavibacteria bacterium]
AHSTDNGDSWSYLNVPEGIRSITMNSNGHIFAGTVNFYEPGGIFRSTDIGNNWTQINNGLTNLHIRTLIINSEDHIFAGTAGGVFRSLDNGESWDELNSGLTDLRINCFAFDLTQHLFAGTPTGVFKSTESTIPAEYSCPSGMISYWKLDETNGHVFHDEKGISDAVGNNYVRPTTEGQVNGAQRINGATSKIDVQANPAYDFGANTPFSVELWYRGNSYPLTNGVAVGRLITNTGARWYVSINANGRPEFYMLGDRGGPSQKIVGRKSIIDNKWHYIAATRSASTMSIYVDGVLQNKVNKTFTLPFSSATAPINIGWFSRDPSYALRGKLDEIALYNKELAPEEILHHYNNGLLHLGYCEQTGLSKQTAEKELNESENSAIPTEYQLQQNYPNPFNPSTKIIFSIPKETELKINIYNMLGEKIMTAIEGKFEPGTYQKEIDASNLPSGIYVYRLESSEFVVSRKMIVLK